MAFEMSRSTYLSCATFYVDKSYNFLLNFFVISFVEHDLIFQIHIGRYNRIY